MSPLEIAHKYMDCFYGQAPLEGMAQLLAEDMKFTGPLYKFETGQDYFMSLLADPVENASYEILYEYQNNKTACLIYLFRKPGVETVMSQVFEVTNDKINNILLVFDTGNLLIDNRRSG